jgi:hypothetical protein
MAALTATERWSLTRFRTLLGPMTADEALDIACEHDALIERVSPHDTHTVSHLAEVRDRHLKFAELIEKEQS